MSYKDPARRREYDRKWFAKRRAEGIAAKGGKCGTCGSRKDLEFHHRNRYSKISHRVWSWAEKRRNKELRKCDLLCHECHRQETSKQRPRSKLHGTTTQYWYGCRCTLCKTAKALNYKRYKQRRRIAQAG